MTDRHVPPYDELRDANTGDGADGVRKAFDADNAGPSGHLLLFGIALGGLVGFGHVPPAWGFPGYPVRR